MYLLRHSRLQSQEPEIASAEDRDLFLLSGSRGNRLGLEMLTQIKMVRRKVMRIIIIITVIMTVIITTTNT